LIPWIFSRSPDSNSWVSKLCHPKR